MAKMNVNTQVVRLSDGSVLSSTNKLWDMGTGLIKSLRQADVSGFFTPGVYKITPFYAITRTVTPSGSGNGEVFISASQAGLVNIKTYSGDIGLAGHGLATLAFDNCVKKDDIVFTSLKNEALLRAFGNVGDLSQLELGTELGELRETWSLLWETILSIFRAPSNWRNFLSHLKTEKGVKQLTEKVISSLPGGYMEFRYGWMPLMRSIHDILEVLKEGLRKLDVSDRICTARGKAKRTIRRFYGPVQSSSYSYIKVGIDVSCNCTAKAYVHYKVKNAPGLMDLLGLSPKFIPETTWQLAKLSFVWDWFVTLGAWLSAIRGFVDGDYQILGNCVTTTIVGDGKSELTEPVTLGKFKAYGDFFNKEVVRQVNLPLPLPQIRYSNVLDIYKYVDLLIIGSQFLPKQLRQDLRRSFAKVIGTKI